MDTILYFYQKRGLTAPYVEPVGLKKYMLIRIGLDVRQETWFGVGLTGECPGAGADRPEPFRGKGFSAAVENGGKKALTEAAAAGGRIRRRKIWQLWNLPGHLAGGESGKFFTRKRRHGTRQGKEREAPEEGQEKIRRVRDIMGKLAAEAAELAGEESRIWYVYEDSVRKCLTEKGESPSGEENPAQRQRKLLPSLWEQYFEQKEFADYCGLFWAEQLLEKALLPHFVVLGTADCIFEILERYAGKMKSLRWILPEADCTGEILDFVENTGWQSPFSSWRMRKSMEGCGLFAKRHPTSWILPGSPGRRGRGRRKAVSGWTCGPWKKSGTGFAGVMLKLRIIP